MATKMARTGVARNSQVLVGRAAALLQLKALVFSGVALPVAPFLKMLKLPGYLIFCLAKLVHQVG